MNVVNVLARARSQIGLPTTYRMGGGKITPVGSDCRDESKSADCSAFICWVLGFRKWQAESIWYMNELNDGWYSTDGMWLDARRSFGFFEELAFPLPGAIVVYPAHRGRMGLPSTPGPKVGHVGIVTEVSRRPNTRAGRAGLLDDVEYVPTAAKKVVHCSGGNFRGWGDAIRETDAAVWKRRRSTIYAWPSSVRPDVPVNLRT